MVDAFEKNFELQYHYLTVKVKEMQISEKPIKHSHEKECAYVCPWDVLLDTVLKGTLEVRHSPGERICGERLQLLENSEQFVVRPLNLNRKIYHLQVTTNTDTTGSTCLWSS